MQQFQPVIFNKAKSLICNKMEFPKNWGPNALLRQVKCSSSLLPMKISTISVSKMGKAEKSAQVLLYPRSKRSSSLSRRCFFQGDIHLRHFLPLLPWQIYDTLPKKRKQLASNHPPSSSTKNCTNGLLLYDIIITHLTHLSSWFSQLPSSSSSSYGGHSRSGNTLTLFCFPRSHNSTKKGVRPFHMITNR